MRQPQQQVTEVDTPIVSIVITLPDGAQRRFAPPTSVAEVAAAIGPGLARNTVAGKVDGPVIEDGFYNDIAFDRSFTPEDMAALLERLQPSGQREVV